MDLVHPQAHSGPMEWDDRGGEIVTDSTWQPARKECAFYGNVRVVRERS